MVKISTEVTDANAADHHVLSYVEGAFKVLTAEVIRTA